MAGQQPSASCRMKHRLRYPEGELKPDDFKRFIQLGSFTGDWKRLKMNDDDLAALETAIMLGPDLPPVIEGTGSLRKVRFGRVGTGKSKGIRVCYSHFPESAVIVLLVAYSHNEQDNLTPNEKRQIKQLLSDIAELLAKGN